MNWYLKYTEHVNAAVDVFRVRCRPAVVIPSLRRRNIAVCNESTHSVLPLCARKWGLHQNEATHWNFHFSWFGRIGWADGTKNIANLIWTLIISNFGELTALRFGGGSGFWSPASQHIGFYLITRAMLRNYFISLHLHERNHEVLLCATL